MLLETDNFEISYFLHIQKRYSKLENQNIYVSKSIDNSWINSFIMFKIRGLLKNLNVV